MLGQAGLDLPAADRPRARRHQRDPQGLRLGGESRGRDRLRPPRRVRADHGLHDRGAGGRHARRRERRRGQPDRAGHRAARSHATRTSRSSGRRAALDKNTLPKLKDSNIPIFYSPEKLARGLKSLLDYHAWRDHRARARRRRQRRRSPTQQGEALARIRRPHDALGEGDASRSSRDWGIPVHARAAGEDRERWQSIRRSCSAIRSCSRSIRPTSRTRPRPTPCAWICATRTRCAPRSTRS